MDLSSSHFPKLHVSDEDYEYSDSRDRLSELPDSLILDILSLLNVRDNVRTSALSKRWKDVWLTVPCLKFMDDLREHIFKALAQWKGTKILKFSLSFYRNTNLSTADINSFLLFAVEKQVEDLDFDLGPYSHRYKYSLIEYLVPQRLYSCSSITKLSLRLCNLNINENVQWKQLKSLELDFMGSSSLGDALYRIISGSPWLENLKLSFYKLFGNIDIRSSSLKKLTIKSSYQSYERPVLRIWAPNLLTLTIRGYVRVTSSWDVPSLTNAVIRSQIAGERIYSSELFNRVFLNLRRVEKITLSDWCIQFLLYMKREKDMVVHFSNAKFLQLYYGGVHESEIILNILDMFPQLVMLIVKLDKRRGGDRYSNFGGTLPSPSLLQLKKVEITWFPHKYSSIFRVMEILFQNAHVLEKMVFRVTGYAGGGSHLHEFLMAKEKVMRMPRSSPTSEVIILEAEG